MKNSKKVALIVVICTFMLTACSANPIANNKEISDNPIAVDTSLPDSPVASITENIIIKSAFIPNIAEPSDYEPVEHESLPIPELAEPIVEKPFNKYVINNISVEIEEGLAEELRAIVEQTIEQTIGSLPYKFVEHCQTIVLCTEYYRDDDPAHTAVILTQDIESLERYVLESIAHLFWENFELFDLKEYWSASQKLGGSMSPESPRTDFVCISSMYFQYPDYLSSSFPLQFEILNALFLDSGK